MTNMSVIIRLQNLPWSANAADIRAYFHGLSIPEGGVHIVGGEQGDAFIAFSTDEDARQAMLLDGGKLKEIKIKLYLSSRTEMLKVIEQARQQAIKLQTLITANPPPALAVPPPPTNVVARKSEEEIKEPPPEEMLKIREKDEDINNKRDRKDRSSSRDKNKSGRSKDGDRPRDRSRNRDRRDRERDRRRRDRSRSRDRYRSRRSRSRERRRSGREESKESHRGTGASGRRSRDSDEDKNEMSGKNDSNQSWELQQQSQPQPSVSAPSKPALLPDPPALPQMLLQMQHNGKETIQPNLPNAPLQQPIINYVSTDPERRHFPGAPQMPQIGNFAGIPPIRMREGWPAMAGPMGPMPVHLDPSQIPLQRPPLLMPDMPLTTFPPQGFPGQSVYSTGTDGFDHPMWRMMSQHPEETHENNDAESCIEIRGLPLNASYIDVKKLFDGLTIPSDGIKMINDTQGNRTGIAYVKFGSSAQKKSALNQNGKKVRSNVVEVLHLRDDIYKTAVDNYKPEKDSIIKEVDMDIDNGESNDVTWPKDNRRDNRGGGRERKFQDPYRINPAMEYKRQQDPRQDGRQDGRPDPRSTRGGDRSDRSEREPRMDRQDKMERLPRFDRGERMDRPDRQERMDNRRMDRQEILEMSNSILIKNLPEQCNERDILDFFSELGVAPLNIHLMQDSVGQPLGEAYCQFENDEEADKAATKNGANMGRLVVSVEKVAPDEYEQAVGIWEPPSHPTRPMYNALPPLLPIPPEYHYRSAHHDEKESDRSSYGEEERYDKKGDQRGNRGNYGMNDRYGGRMGGNNSGGMRGGREGRGRGRSRFSGGPPPPPLLGNNLGEPLMPGPPMGGPRGPRGAYGGGGGGPNPGGPYIDGDVVDNFGKPGCVVALENLHFRADIDEIISLFSNFDVEHEDVIRRFDERGRPTGDARVSLKSPSEAMRAVRELQFSQLRGRTIKVSLLQN